MSINEVANQGKNYSLNIAGFSGGVGFASKMVSMVLKDGKVKNIFNAGTALGGMGFLAGASVFTGIFLAEKTSNAIMA